MRIAMLCTTLLVLTPGLAFSQSNHSEDSIGRYLVHGAAESERVAPPSVLASGGDRYQPDVQYVASLPGPPAGPPPGIPNPLPQAACAVRSRRSSSALSVCTAGL